MEENQMAREWIGMRITEVRWANLTTREQFTQFVLPIMEVAAQYGIDLSREHAAEGRIYPLEDEEAGALSVMERMLGGFNFDREMAIQRLTPTQKRELDTLAAVKEVPQTTASRRTYDVLVARGLATVGPMAADFNVTGYRYVAEMTLADLMADTIVGSGSEPDTTSHH